MSVGGGLTHLGLVYDSPDDLVESVLPHLRNALRAGDAVSTLVDRGTSRGLRDALGDDADRVGFRTPVEEGAPPPRPDDLVRRLRQLCPPRRRGLVLAQYSAFPVPDADLALGEDGINLVLGDLPLTLVCACARDAAGAAVGTVRHHHPHLVRGRVTEDNPLYRAPDDRCPTDSATWGGEHALRLPFRDSGDLQRIRAHVASLAAGSGLRHDDATAAVFAAHEAAVLACDGAELAAPDRAVDACVLDAWTATGRLVVEVRGPHPPPAGGGTGPRIPRDRTRMPDPMRYVRMFCPDVAALGACGERTIRIVT